MVASSVLLAHSVVCGVSFVCAALTLTRLQVLQGLKVEHVPITTVWNKIDAAAAPDSVRKVCLMRILQFPLAATPVLLATALVLCLHLLSPAEPVQNMQQPPSWLSCCTSCHIQVAA